jgi:hypothetical protein
MLDNLFYMLFDGTQLVTHILSAIFVAGGMICGFALFIATWDWAHHD